MDVRLVLLLGLLAAAAAPLASLQLAPGFYRASCPDAEKIIFTVVERRFKQDPGTAAVLLRLLFHDCFANGCDGSILIDPLSNQSSEKEAGPNISVRGYDIIDEIKEELEKRCPNVVSCADIVAVSARDGVRLSGGPAYEVPTGRRDSLESNREEADNNLPGPDIPVPKLMAEFAAKGFGTEELIALLAGGHSIGHVRCIFIEPDAAPMDPEYRESIGKLCDGNNRDEGSVSMDSITPNVMDGNYFALVLAKKMPLTIDRLMGLDARTMPLIQAMSTKPADVIPMFAKAMEKLSVLKVITGKDGEIRRSCSEFNNPNPNNNGPSVIRISSVLPGEMEGLSAPGVKGGAAEARKVAGGGAEPRKVNGIEGSNKVAAGEEIKKVPGVQTEVADKATGGGVEIKKAASNMAAGNQATGVKEIEKVNGGEAARLVAGGAEMKKVAGNEAASKVAGGAEMKKVAGNEAASKVAGGAEMKNVAGNEVASKVAGGVEPNIVIGGEAASKVPAAGVEEIKKRHHPKLRGGHQQ